MANQFWQNLGRFATGVGKSVVTSAVDTGVDAGRSYVGGLINEYFNKRSEERADARNRSLLYDQPRITAEGRRAAGLNPYGEATLPGMSAQSATDAQLGSMASSFEQLMSLKRLRLDEDIARSEIKKNEAETQYTLESIVGISLSNEIKEIEKEVASFNFSLDKQKAPLLLEQIRSSISKLNAEKEKLLASAEVDEKHLAVMDASIEKMTKELSLLDAQIALAESGVELNEATIQNMRDRLAFDKDVEERVKTQGLAGLRIDAASLGLQSERFDWEKMAKEVDQDLRDEGIDVNWANLGVDVLGTLVFALSIYLSGNPSVGAVTSKGVTSIVKRVLRTSKK